MIVEWIVDGFLHPPAQVRAEFVDVDEFARLPVAGLSDAVQFAHLRVIEPEPAEHIVVGSEGLTSRLDIERFLAGRYPSARLTFLLMEEPGSARVLRDREELTEARAACAAVTRYSLAWDNGKPIKVSDSATTFDVFVEYTDGTYRVTCHQVP